MKDLIIEAHRYEFECNCYLNGKDSSEKNFVIEHESVCVTKEFACNLYNERSTLHLHFNQIELDKCLKSQKDNKLYNYYKKDLIKWFKTFKCHKGHLMEIEFWSDTLDLYCSTCKDRFEYNITEFNE